MVGKTPPALNWHQVIRCPGADAPSPGVGEDEEDEAAEALLLICLAATSGSAAGAGPEALARSFRPTKVPE